MKIKTFIFPVLLVLILSSSYANEKPAENLVINGDFEETENPLAPEGWEPIENNNISIATDGSKHNKVLLLNVPRKVARSTGLMYYTTFFNIEQNTTYTLRFDAKTQSQKISAKVWLKGYAEINGVKREVYKAGHYCHNEHTNWGTYTRAFTPQSRKYEVKWAKVMLYAHGADAAKVWFDNIIVRPITGKEAEEIKSRGAERWTGKPSKDEGKKKNEN